MAIGDGKTYCFYHSADLDGLCSGAIVKYFIPHAIMMPINYGDVFPWHTLTHNDEVLMCDFSLDAHEMLRLMNTVALLHWIDHHDTAICAVNEMLMDNALVLCGMRNNEKDPALKRAACELTWEYLAPFGIPVPRAVDLLGMYDTWRYVGTKDETDVWAFQLRMRLEELNPVLWGDCRWFWENLFGTTRLGQEHIERLINDGYILARFDEQNKRKYAQTYAFESEFIAVDCDDPTCEGGFGCPARAYTILAVNLGHTNSRIFDSVPNREKYAFFVSFARRTDGQWHVSLYGNPPHSDVHVGEIAKLFGGGGHAGAAGFNCTTEDLPFNI